MENIVIEIPESLRDDFTKAVHEMQDNYYAKQILDKDKPELKKKHLEKFMELSKILETLENGAN